MRYLSVCSGIEAATQAWHQLGWTPVAFSEIESFPSSVLKYRYPDVPNWGDMTRWREWPDEKIEVLVGGTPCQSFSVAGLRKGLTDPRGGLMLDYVGIAGRYRPKYIIWENVPGVLTSNGGRDFGTLLGALGDLGYDLAYRVLDAQWVRTQQFPHAVPQRRRRVFVVGCLGERGRAAEILFKSESLCGNPPTRRKTGQGLARDVAPSLVSSGRGVERTGESRGQDPVVGCWWDGGQVSQTLDAVLSKGQTMPEKNRFPAVLQGKLDWPADVSCSLNASFGNKQGLEDQHVDSACPMFVPGVVAPTLTATNDPSRSPQSAEITAQVAAVVEAMAFAQNQVGEVRTNNIANTLNTNSNASGRNTPLVAVSVDEDLVLMDQGGSVMQTLQDGSVGTLRREMHGHEPIVLHAVGTDCYNGAITGDVAATMGTPGSSVNASGPTVMQPVEVPDVAGTMKSCANSGGWSNSADHAAAGYMLPVSDTANGVAFTFSGYSNQPAWITGDRTDCLSSSGHSDGSHQGIGIITNPTSFHPTQDPIPSEDGKCHAIGCGSKTGCATAAVAYVKSTNPHNKEEAPTFNETEVAACLNGWDERHNPPKHMAIAMQDVRGLDKKQNGRGWNDEGTSYTVDASATQGVAVDAEGVAYHASRRDSVRVNVGVSPTVEAQWGTGGNNVPNVMNKMPPMVVRRLTPEECESLQGFPRGWTNIPHKKKPDSPDGPRYKALGNSMACNCMQWLGERIQAAENRTL
jgi:site-specific DNA-cytosine methylase